jgi:hypothetical protein
MDEETGPHSLAPNLEEAQTLPQHIYPIACARLWASASYIHRMAIEDAPCTLPQLNSLYAPAPPLEVCVLQESLRPIHDRHPVGIQHKTPLRHRHRTALLGDDRQSPPLI